MNISDNEIRLRHLEANKAKKLMLERLANEKKKKRFDMNKRIPHKTIRERFKDKIKKQKAKPTKKIDKKLGKIRRAVETTVKQFNEAVGMNLEDYEPKIISTPISASYSLVRKDRVVIPDICECGWKNMEKVEICERCGIEFGKVLEEEINVLG